MKNKICSAQSHNNSLIQCIVCQLADSPQSYSPSLCIPANIHLRHPSMTDKIN